MRAPRPWACRWLGVSMGVMAASLVGAEEAAFPEQTAFPLLVQLFWALILMGLVVLAGIIWVGMIRRDVRRKTETVRQRETALEEHYRELFENAHDIIYTHDLQGNLTSLNKAGEQALGYTLQEAAKLNFGQFVASCHQELFRQLLRDLAQDKRQGNCELECVAKNGRRLILQTNLRLQYREGIARQIQGIAWDVTGRKEAEEAQQESEERLRRSLEERVRIGRDLHDGIIQSIYAIGLGLQNCRRMLSLNPAEADGLLAKTVADLNLVIGDVRNFIMGLEPEALKGREFKTALQALVLNLNKTDSVQFSFDVDPGAANVLSRQQATHLLQIAREAMSNSLRHAQAQHASVSLQLNHGAVRMVVRDDGIGFVPDQGFSRGHGLRNVTARAMELGARSEIRSAPGEGTRVCIELPLGRTDEPA